MGLLDMMRFGTHPQYTPEMMRALRKSDNIKDKKQLLIDLQRQTDLLTKHDIGAWRLAWQRAIDVQNPNRCALLDIYNDIAIDMHLTGCIGQRKGFVSKRGFKIIDRSGKRDEALTALFETEWFDEFVSLVLDSRYYGHSLIEFDVPFSANGKLQFPVPKLVPRKHVRPEYGVIVRNQNDNPQNGISYRDGDLADWCIEVGRPDDLGLFLKCCPSALSKKNMLAFWDGFAEIFGMPIRIAHTSSQDQAERSKIQRMLDSMGTAFYGVFSEGTDIEIKESARPDAYCVYDKRIDRANSEISKGILNQTMTIDCGASLAQAQVHLDVFENIIAADQKLILNVVNNLLIPFMIKHGFPLEGYRYAWDDKVSFTPEQIQAVEQMLINGGYDIDPKYFTDKYGVKIIGKREESFFE